ncbi:GIY-YIG nuclease family protein [Lutibacter sp. TH_r2]|uniref:GIY-YIG nuclease family protein n=1 Tax=Lutibacter sp. TH_r2 TaxID=3082083 RepID=UPI002952DA58|nr:GIY-YIG nuclease family protein [Lutibacter sp. TH_r2]MDV7187627.1 GIY-YIG nuclease family protein [Lutibacter sp. TH_r2]
MDKDSILNEIFENDPLGILIVKPKKSAARTSDERLAASFDTINDFFEKNKREPKPDPTNISEYQLYATLKGLRENHKKMEALEPQDIYGLLNTVKKEINSIDDIFDDDSLDIFNDEEEGLFDFKHTPKDFNRAKTDFMGKRVVCKDFDKYEHLFTTIQNDLSLGKRKLVDFKEANLREGSYYVHNGILFLLESINYDREDHYKEDGTRVRKDGRTRCIFENGTESNILKRSVEKNLYANGKVVTENINDFAEEFIENFSDINENDKEAGYIYVLTSKSKKEEISSIKNLYKIGYSRTSIEERIKNAENEPTYLMAAVKLESAWKCYNMNAQKFENIIHKFFGNSCLEVDVFDRKGIRHTPREWFIVPLEAVEQAVALITTEKIIDYKYDNTNMVIVKK